jgi:hypothetical protein
MDDFLAPTESQLRFPIGAVITHPGADAALGEDIDLVLQLVAHHLQHAEPYEHGWLSGVRYRGQQIAVATVRALNETHVFAAAEARALGDQIHARTRRKFSA